MNETEKALVRACGLRKEYGKDGGPRASRRRGGPRRPAVARRLRDGAERLREVDSPSSLLGGLDRP